MNNIKLTSVKLIKGIYDEFKLRTVNSEMTLQKVTNRALKMYLEDKNYREQVDTNKDLSISGSNF
tara:strand:- start:347 stop:541 length:195 start_codon:yes stop_codon:yes gene_type:complete